MKKLVFIALGLFMINIFANAFDEKELSKLNNTLQTAQQEQESLTEQLFYAMQDNDYDKIKSLLVEKHVSPNVRMDWNELFGVPALWFACNTDKSADYKIVKLLIQHGANPLCQVGDRDHDFVSLDFKYEDTPLSYAVHSGNIKLATTLINESRKKGYDIVNALINEDFTALTVATESLNLDMVQLLIDNHANPNLGEETPLAWLQRSGFILIPLRYKLEEGKKIIDLLLDSGAEINIYDEDGRSALHALNDAIENRLDPEGELVKQVKEFRDYLVQKGF